MIENVLADVKQCKITLMIFGLNEGNQIEYKYFGGINYKSRIFSGPQIKESMDRV